MKAAVHTKYSLPGDLRIMELDVPTPKDKAGGENQFCQMQKVNEKEWHLWILQRIDQCLMDPCHSFVRRKESRISFFTQDQGSA
jgi:hypothetical protein